MQDATNNCKNLCEKKNGWFNVSEGNQEIPKNVPRYLVVKIEEQGKTFNEINPFDIHRWVSSFSKNITVKKMKKSGLLFLDSPSNSITSILLKQELFKGLRISVQPHNTLNQSKGVLYCPELRDLKEEEILQELIEQGVSKVRRLGNPSKKSGLFVATFNTPQLPEKLFVGYLSVPIRAYIPPPLLCYRCGALGHHMSSCEKEQVCRKCSEPLHDNECKKIKCCLCGEEHRTTAKLCPVYAEEYEVKKVMVLQNVTYFEAKRQVKGARTGTYAEKVMSVSTDSNNLDKVINLIELMNKRIAVIENLLIRKQLETKSLNPEEGTTISGHGSCEVEPKSTTDPKSTRNDDTTESDGTTGRNETQGKDSSKTHRRQNESKTPTNRRQVSSNSKKR